MKERMKTELIQQLWQSTEKLLGEFKVQQSPETALSNILEEMREYLLAPDEQNALEEACDVMVTCMSLAISLGYTFDDVYTSALSSKMISVISMHEPRYHATMRLMMDVALAKNNIHNLGLAILRMSYRTNEDMVQRVIAKNDAKTYATHYVNEHGKIRATSLEPLADNTATDWQIGDKVEPTERHRIYDWSKALIYSISPGDIGYITELKKHSDVLKFIEVTWKVNVSWEKDPLSVPMRYFAEYPTFRLLRNE